ncbi:Cro/CI family transcriptional regulator [Marinomonas posidonica]|uniref:Cro/CI family transcriptional regulator n=1 Tax=Marinomonas posidonica TaxID=936476 RepID=UPI00373533C5
MLKHKVMKHFGSQTNLSAVLKISPSSISQWGEIIPEKQALRIEKLTNGELKYDPAFYSKSA